MRQGRNRHRKGDEDINDAAATQGMVIELNAKILAAQSSVFAANEERSSLLDRVGELEKEVVRLKAWGAEKERYQFAEVGPGVFAYTLKPNHGKRGAVSGFNERLLPINPLLAVCDFSCDVLKQSKICCKLVLFFDFFDQKLLKDRPFGRINLKPELVAQPVHVVRSYEMIQ
jgi:hypothetical protein